MQEDAIIPEVQGELAVPKRLPGQDIGNGSQTTFVSDYKGTKTDSDSYARSRNKVYKRKIASQRKRKNS